MAKLRKRHNPRHSYYLRSSPKPRTKRPAGDRQKTPSRETSSCVICIDTYKGPTKSVKCGHRFHVHCINAWLKESNSCPVCRFQIKPSFYRLLNSSRDTRAFVLALINAQFLPGLLD